MEKYFRILTVVFFLSGNFQYLQSQWVQQSGPTWGSANCFAVSGGTLLVGTEHGAFSSTDKGRSWSPMPASLPSTNIQALAVSGTTIFAGAFYGGVFRSTDNGCSWSAMSMGMTNNQILSLVVSGNNIFAGTYGGVFRSTVNGTDWTAAGTELAAQGVSALTVSGTDLYAGTKSGGVFRSSNNGASWTAVNTGLTGKDVYALAVSDTNIFAAIYGEGVFRSTNKGASWTAVNPELSSSKVKALFASGASLFAATNSGGIFRTLDNGTHWSEVYKGMWKFDINALVNVDTLLFAAVSNGDIFYSVNNGDHWDVVSTNLQYSTISSLAISGDTVLAGTASAGVYRSANNGTSWLPSNTGLTSTHISALIVSGSDLFAGTDSGVCISANKGASWSFVNNGLKRMKVNTLFLSGMNLFAGTDSGVFISANNGANWIDANTGLSTDAGAIPAVAAFASVGGNIFAGTTSGLYRTADNGNHWMPAGSKLPAGGISALAAADGNIFAATENSSGVGTIYRSADSGATWIIASPGISYDHVTALLIHSEKIIAGSSYGIHLSTDNGKNWMDLVDGLGSNRIQSLAGSETHLYAGTNMGVWSRAFGDFDIPKPPVLASPADSSIDLPNTYFDLVWNASPFAMRYRMQLASDTAFASIIDAQNIFYGCKCTVSALLKNKTYYWRVMAANDMGESAWSDVWSFTTIGFGTTIVKLVSPSNGSSSGASDMKFVWRKCTAPVLYYCLEMFTESYRTYVETADTSFTFNVPSSLSAKTYSWRVRVKTDTGYSQYGDVWTFMKMAANVPDSGSAVNRIELVSPLNGSRVGGGDSVRFTWRKPAVPYAWYALEMWGTQYYYFPTSDTTVMFALPGSTDKIYAWRVRSYTDTGSYSGLWSFTKLVTSAPLAEVVPTEFALGNNYPNPFNPSTTFSFALPIRSYVTLKIFDMLGREVSTIVSETLPAGAYTRRWDATGYRSGVYLYRLQAGSFVETKRLVYLK